MSWKRVTRCCEPKCERGRFVYGRCSDHFRQMDPALYARLQSMTRAERNAEFDQMRIHPPASKWRFEPTPEQEAELAAMVEKQEREKSEEQQNA
jgi:hypothetical protein